MDHRPVKRHDVALLDPALGVGDPQPLAVNFAAGENFGQSRLANQSAAGSQRGIDPDDDHSWIIGLRSGGGIARVGLDLCRRPGRGNSEQQNGRQTTNGRSSWNGDQRQIHGELLLKTPACRRMRLRPVCPEGDGLQQS